jgi:hypothetical protein
MSYALLLIDKVCLMVVETYRKSLPGKSTRVAFTKWLNEQLGEFDLSLSIGYLQNGRKTPSLPLAIGIEKATGGVVSVREWPGLNSSLRS